jgi:hypothetical protein
MPVMKHALPLAQSYRALHFGITIQDGRADVSTTF